MSISIKEIKEKSIIKKITKIQGKSPACRQIQERVRRLYELLLQLLFPLRCPVCDRIAAPFGEKICDECLKELRLITPPYCMKCGKKVAEGEEYCVDCSKASHHFACGRALYEYNSVAAGIYRFKYGNRREYALAWGEEMAYYLGDFIRSTGAEGLIPVPLHTSRLRQRGYNQAECLARAVGGCMNIPVYDKYVRRVRATRPLKLLTPRERQNNLKKAFIIGQNDVKLKVVIIVDDIYTTGSTMDAIAEVLRDAGTERIYFLTLSCGASV